MHLLALFLQSQPDPEMVRRIAMTMLAIIPIIILVAIVIVMVPFWFILKKAGFSPWLSLLCIVPSLGNADPALRPCLCRVEGRARTPDGLAAALSSAAALSAAAVSAPGLSCAGVSSTDPRRERRLPRD